MLENLESQNKRERVGEGEKFTKMFQKFGNIIIIQPDVVSNEIGILSGCLWLEMSEVELSEPSHNLWPSLTAGMGPLPLQKSTPGITFLCANIRKIFLGEVKGPDL